MNKLPVDIRSKTVSLQVELNLRKPFALLPHEALLSTYYTASRVKKKACEFLSRFGVTEVQFNLLMLLKHQSGPDDGLDQAELGEMMLVNRANVTALVDRMEKAGLVVRTQTPEDRRRNIVRLTESASRLLAQIEPLYVAEVERIMAVLDRSEQMTLITMLERIRGNI